MKLFAQWVDFVRENRDLVPILEKIPLSEIQNRFQYVGGQIAGGCLYSVVNSAEKMLRYHISERKMEFLGSFDAADFKWTGECLYEDRLYMFSRLKSSLLSYDIKTERFEEIKAPFSYEGEHHYGGACTQDGIVYQPPRNTNHILRWDLRERTCEKIMLSDEEPCRYCGSVLHPDGSIYFIPERDRPVLRLTPTDGKINPIGNPICGMTFNPTVAYDGNIYGFRSAKGKNGCGILKIDTKSQSVSILHDDIGFHAYGTKNGINGKLYSLPGYTPEIWEFDPCSCEVRCFDRVKEGCAPYYAGGATDENGDIYALPVYADHILKISFGKHGAFIPKELHSAFYTDFY